MKLKSNHPLIRFIKFTDTNIYSVIEGGEVDTCRFVGLLLTCVFKLLYISFAVIVFFVSIYLLGGYALQLTGSDLVDKTNWAHFVVSFSMGVCISFFIIVVALMGVCAFINFQYFLYRKAESRQEVEDKPIGIVKGLFLSLTNKLCTKVEIEK